MAFSLVLSLLIPFVGATSGTLFAQTGPLTSYLVGTFDLNEGARTLIHIINPTRKGLWVKVGFFKVNGDPLRCRADTLNANGVLVLNVDAHNTLGQKFGVVKVVAFRSRFGPPEIGIVANARYIKGSGISETQLHPIPYDILKDDLIRFKLACP